MAAAGPGRTSIQAHMRNIQNEQTQNLSVTHFNESDRPLLSWAVPEWAYGICYVQTIQSYDCAQIKTVKIRQKHMQINSTHLEQQTERRQRHLLCTQTLTTYIQKPVP